MIRQTLVLSLAVGLSAGPASAQDFLGRMARAAAERAATAVAGRAVEAVVSGGAAPDRRAPAPAPAAPAASAQAPAVSASDFAAPAPVNYRSDMTNPHDLEFSPEDAGGKQRLTTFSRHSCSDCEGGYAFGAWVGHYVSALWGDHVLAGRLGGMTVGQHVDWQVPAMRGSGRIEVVGDQAIGPWACKQVRWTVTRPEGASDRMGLVCRVPRRNAEPRWEEIL